MLSAAARYCGRPLNLLSKGQNKKGNQTRMKIVRDSISLDELRQMAEPFFGEMVKAVVDVERELMAVDSGLHSDLEALLLEDGSQQANLWGINVYPDAQGDELIEFDSMINVRPLLDNRSRGVENSALRVRIRAIVNSRIHP